MSYLKSYRVVPNSEKTPKVTVFLLTMLKKGVYFGKSARRNRFYQKKICKFVCGRKIYLFQAELLWTVVRDVCPDDIVLLCINLKRPKQR